MKKGKCLLIVTLLLYSLTLYTVFSSFSTTNRLSSDSIITSKKTLYQQSSFNVQAEKVKGMVNGIDVSHYQEEIDWPFVVKDGYKFAFCKATEGATYTDPRFNENIQEGDDAGMVMGAYHFARPWYDHGDARAEAEHFLNVTGKYLEKGFLRPVLDLEDGAIMGQKNLSHWVHVYMNTVKNNAGVEPIIYCNSNYAETAINASVTQYDLWIADWTYNPRNPPNTGLWNNWNFWQYSNEGDVEGITGNVDLDMFNGNVSELNNEFVIGQDTTSPSISVTAPTPSETINTSQVTVKWESSDNVLLAPHEIRINNDGWRKVAGNRYTFTNLTDGNYTVKVKAIDGAGNTATDTVDFTIKTKERNQSINTGATPPISLIAGVSGVIVIGIIAVVVYLKKR